MLAFERVLVVVTPIRIWLAGSPAGCLSFFPALAGAPGKRAFESTSGDCCGNRLCAFAAAALAAADCNAGLVRSQLLPGCGSHRPHTGPAGEDDGLEGRPVPGVPCAIYFLRRPVAATP